MSGQRPTGKRRLGTAALSAVHRVRHARDRARRGGRALPQLRVAPDPADSTGFAKRFIVAGVPVGKPTMTQRDRWRLRPAVLRYRAWCDAIRKAAGWPQPAMLYRPIMLDVTAYWPGPTRHRPSPHGPSVYTSKPDADNVLKAVADALFANDERIWSAACRKYYDDGAGPRVEVVIT